MNCHMDDGTGLRDMIPPVHKPFNRTAKDVVCLIRNGQSVVDSSAMLAMPSFPQLSTVDIANVLNYIGWKWQKEHDFMTADDVEKALNSCK